jgi:hypothetical protein
MKKTFYIIAINIIIFISGIIVIPASSESIGTVSNWQQINEDGFGKIYNRAPRGTAIFNDTFIIGIGNYNDTSNIAAEKIYPLRYFIENIISVFHGEGFKSNGCEIWAYNNTTWWPLIGDYNDAIMSAGFGNKNNLEVGDLIEFNGYLYAGIRNHYDGCQIWRTKSIEEPWELVLKNGSGNLNNVWFSKFAIFNNQLYVGTQNYEDGFEMFRTSTGNSEEWECVIGKNADTDSGFGQKTGGNHFAWSMEVYDGYLYLGLHGGNNLPGQIWRTNDGLKWEPVICYNNIISAKLNGAYMPASFGIYSTGGIRDMVVYKNELYVGTCGGFYLDIVFPRFGKIFTYSPRFHQLNFIKKRMTLGANLWKYNSSSEKWSKVVAGNGNEVHKGGFGDPLNVYFWDMKVYDDYLYVSTMHMEHNQLVFSRNGLFNWSVTLKDNGGHGELWRYDGEEWVPLVGKNKALEFDEDYNMGIREIRMYQGKLLMATMNVKTGCEIWQINVS